MGVKSIAQSLGLVTSTCLHILRVLVQERLVTVDAETKRYKLGVGMLSLARSVIERNSFANVAQPDLDRLSREWGVTAIGVEIVGLEHMVVVTLSRSQMPFSLHLDVGSRFPALISATGRLNAAFSDRPWNEIEQGFKRLRWQNAPDPKTWRAEVEAVRRMGYSIDRGNYINGVTIVAVPLFDTSKRVNHAIVAAGVAHQLDIENGDPCMDSKSFRVPKLIEGKATVDRKSVAKKDIYVTPDQGHCGMVIAVVGQGATITIRHDSSAQGGVVENDFDLFFKGKGAFYRYGR